MWPEDEEYEKGFDTAQVCRNGHMINVCFQRSPDFNQKYCDLCGAQTITCCQYCNSPIRGMRMNKTFLGGSAGRDTIPPSFCYECGKAYPWVEGKLDAARERADSLDNLTLAEREQLKLSLDDIVKDSPKTTVAAQKFRELVAKAGQGVADSLKEILVSVVVETAKKLIWPTG